MKRILSLILTLVMLFCCCSCGEEKTTTTKKKKVVVIKKENESSQNDDGSSENTQSDTEDDVFVSTVIPDKVIENISNETSADIGNISKKTSADIGKNYYILEPVTNHPGVVGMDATYEFKATDKQGLLMNSSDIVLSCDNKEVKIEGNKLIVPYSVRKQGSLTVSMYDKSYPNCTGSYTFSFLKFGDTASFRDDFDSFNEELWTIEDWQNSGNPDEPIYRDGKLVFQTEKEDGSTAMTTKGKYEQAYGCFSVSMKMAEIGSGLCSFWLSSPEYTVYIKNNKQLSESGGEIDVVEYMPGWGDRWAGTVHWYGWSAYHQQSGDDELPVKDPSKAFHTYSTVWTREAIYWYIDGELARVYDEEGVAPDSDPMALRVTQLVQKDDFWDTKYDPEAYPYEVEYDWVEAFTIEE